MNRYQLRPFNFSDEDYQNTVNIWNSVWPDELQAVQNMKHSDETKKDKFWQRIVCELDGRMVGFGFYGKTWWSKREGQYFLTFQTLPEYRNQGIAATFYDQACQTLTQRGDLKVLLADTREDATKSVQFLLNRGFNQVMRYPRSIIDVQAFESQKYAELITKLQQSGVEILNTIQLAERYDDYQQRIYEMETEIEKDIPMPDPLAVIPFEEYREQLFKSPNYYPEGWAVAVANDQFVGLSAVWKTPNKEKLSTGLTGVLRSHRRLGLATALKAKVIGFAKAQGIKEIDTDNEENNPMYQLNMQLGFKPTPAYIDFQKVIKSEHEDKNNE